MTLSRFNRSAFFSIGIFILCLLVVILASLFYYLTSNQVTSNNESMSVTSTLTAQSVMEKVDRNFYERFGDVQAYAYNQLAVATVTKDTVAEGVQDFVNTMTAYYVLYDLMMIVNKDGKVLVVNTKDKNGNAINSYDFVGKDVSGEEWFKACTSGEGPKGGAWFSDFTVNHEIGRMYNSKGHGMGFAAPIKDSTGAVAGVWFNYASWKEVTDGIRAEAEQNLAKDHPGSFVVITKKNGDIISAAHESLIVAHNVKPDESGELHTSNPDLIPLSKLTSGLSHSKGAYTFAGKEWTTIAFIPRDTISWAVFFSKKNIVGVLGSLIVLIIVSISVYSFFRKNILKRINEINDLQQHLAEGEIIEVREYTKSDEFSQIKQSLKKLSESLQHKAFFADEISKGNLDVELLHVSNTDTLGKSLINMQSQLKIAARADAERNWASEGLAQISIILRTFSSTDDLYSRITKFVVTYLKANQGGLFLLKEVDGQQKLVLVSCYAYEKKKYIEKTIDISQGLLGQSVLERETIYLTEVPETYALITSGLGGSSPRSLLIVPLKLNDEIFGVIELASFHKFQKHEIALAEKLAESIAASIGAVDKAEQTKLLLEQLQQQTEQMKAQEEEMRQNMEELSATQEDMIRKEREFRSKVGLA